MVNIALTDNSVPFKSKSTVEHECEIKALEAQISGQHNPLTEIHGVFMERPLRIWSVGYRRRESTCEWRISSLTKSSTQSAARVCAPCHKYLFIGMETTKTISNFNSLQTEHTESGYCMLKAQRKIVKYNSSSRGRFVQNITVWTHCMLWRTNRKAITIKKKPFQK